MNLFLILLFVVLAVIAFMRSSKAVGGKSLIWGSLTCLVLTLSWGCFSRSNDSVEKTWTSVEALKAEMLGADLARQFPGGKAVIFRAPVWEGIGTKEAEPDLLATLRRTMEGMTVQVVTLPLPEAVRARIAQGGELRGDESLLLELSMDRTYFQKIANEWSTQVDVAVLLMSLPTDFNGADPLPPARAKGLRWALLQVSPSLVPSLFERDLLAAAVILKQGVSLQELAEGKNSSSPEKLRQRLVLVTADNYRDVVSK